MVFIPSVLFLIVNFSFWLASLGILLSLTSFGIGFGLQQIRAPSKIFKDNGCILIYSNWGEVAQHRWIKVLILSLIRRLCGWCNLLDLPWVRRLWADAFFLSIGSHEDRGCGIALQMARLMCGPCLHETAKAAAKFVTIIPFEQTPRH